MKTISFIITILLSCTFVFGQTDTTTVPPADSTPLKSTLTLGLVYANNASYYGQKALDKTPYAAFAVSYRHKSGLYLTGLTYKLLNEKSNNVSAASLGAGYSAKLGKRVTADISYAHSYYPGNTPLLQAANPDNATLSLVYDNWLNIGVTGDYAFGHTNDGFATLALSKSINLFSITSKDIIILNPSVDAVAGTQHFYTSYLEQKRLQDSLLGILLPPLTGTSPSGNTKTVATSTFNLLSYNLKLPLSYNRAHYVIEANYQASLLSEYVTSGAGTINSFLTFSFYYQF